MSKMIFRLFKFSFFEHHGFRPGITSIFCGLAVVFGNLFFVLPALPAQIILQWDPNPEANIAGYKIYYGKQSKNYQIIIDTENKATVTLSNLEDGQTYYFAATAYDAFKNESPFSQELFFQTAPKSLPGNNIPDLKGNNKTDILKGTPDFDGDNKTDILWHNQVTGEVYVWFMDGATFIGDQYIRTVGETEWKIVGVGDFNGDGKPDILWHHQQRGDVYVWFMDGPTFLRDQYIRTVGDDLNWKITGIGDFNGDGKPDILWHHQQRGDVYVWFMDGVRFLYDKYIRTVPEIEWQIEAVADYNGDGKIDLLWRNQRTGEVYVWFMDGATFIRDQYIRTVPDTNWKIVN